MTAPTESAQPPLHRIVSYNVRYFGHALFGLASTRKSKRGIAAGLFALAPRPHLICLQEIETQSLRSTLVHRGQRPDGTQLEAFMAELELVYARKGLECPYDAYYFKAHTYRLMRGFNVYTTGLAILVDRFAFKVEAHNVAVPERITHHNILRVKNQKQTRICAHMRLLDKADRPLHIFNTHLSLPSPFAKAFWTGRARLGFSTNQLEESKSLATFVRKAAGSDPFVLCGDFNSPPGSPVYRHLTGDAALTVALETLRPCDEKKPHGFPTAGFMGLKMHLDHILSGGDVRWVDLEGTCLFGDHTNPFHGLSDHVPLMAGFRLGGD